MSDEQEQSFEAPVTEAPPAARVLDRSRHYGVQTYHDAPTEYVQDGAYFDYTGKYAREA